jgi:hypothetical protein
MWLNFHDAIVHDEPIVATVRQSFENMLVVLKVLESAEQSRQVMAAGDVGDGWYLCAPRRHRPFEAGLAAANFRPQRLIPSEKVVEGDVARRAKPPSACPPAAQAEDEVRGGRLSSRSTS